MRLMTTERSPGDAPATAAPAIRRAGMRAIAPARSDAHGAGATSAALRRTVRAYARRLASAERTPRDADVTGVFARAINTGIHDDAAGDPPATPPPHAPQRPAGPR
jgi:hypothetical protein